MADKSAIEWTEATWNPVTGCTKISAGCRNCYAERMAFRLQAMGQPNYLGGFDVAMHESALDLPLRWSKPRLVFVNSMSDLFHERVPAEFIERVFSVMAQCPQHTFQVLTKRSKRLKEIASRLPWPHNVWMGVTIEEGRYVSRIEDLRHVPSAVRFLSCEPLIGPIETLDLGGIHWVIVGGESGPGARPMKPERVEAIMAKCHSAGVPFFFKQWGGTRKRVAGRMLLGRTFDEMPTPRQAENRARAS